MNAKKNKSKASSSTTLAAVALQDHLAKSLSLQDPIRKRKVNHTLPVTKTDKVKAVVKTQRTSSERKPAKQTEEREYVLDSRPPPLSLAQKLGLVESPEQLLSDKQWQQVKKKSNEREDSKQPCVICKEDFGLQQQVLLSCSHVFHRVCLQAFERFSGRKCCPMCRKEQYQTRIIHEGAKQHKVTSATKIQSVWRGYVVRCWYRKLRETNPPKDPKLRRRYYEEKLQSITDRMVRSLETTRSYVDSFLSDIDQSISLSRDIMRNVDENSQTLSVDDWEAVQLKAVERSETECPICIMPLSECGAFSHTNSHKLPDGGTSYQRDIGKRSIRGTRPTVLLSCSHVFHAACLQAFEEFALDQTLICPVCRCVYNKKFL